MKRISTIANPVRSARTLFLAILVLAGSAQIATAQVIKDFEQRTSKFSPTKKIYNIKGTFTMIGNTNLKLAPGLDWDETNNNDMVYVDIDGDANTFNSSSAVLVHANENDANPDCSNIVYAGLYWTGRAHNEEDESPLTFSVTKSVPGTIPSYTTTTQRVYDNDDITYTNYYLNILRSGERNKRTITYTFAPDNLIGNTVSFIYRYNGSIGSLTVSVNGGAESSVACSSIDENNAYLSTPYIVYSESGVVQLAVTRLRREGANSDIDGETSAYVSVTRTSYPNVNVTKTFDKTKVYLKGPNESTYFTVEAEPTDIYYPIESSDLGNYMYSAYAEVTEYVREHGFGNYFVADIALREGNGGGTGYYGGWGMVVVYENSKMKFRDVTIFDGHAYVQGNTTISHELEVNGFNTVQAGLVNMKLGMMAGEGDYSIPGDYFRIQKLETTNWVTLSHTGNATDNFFNSSIATGGNPRELNLVNNTGLDISMFDIPNQVGGTNTIIANGQSSTKFQYGSTQDTYIIFCIAMAVDAYKPVIEGLISATEINSIPASNPTSALPGDIITYKVDIRNKGTEAVTNARVIVPIPYSSTYVDPSVSKNVYFSPLPSPNNIYFDPTMGANGSIVYNIGDLPYPSDPSDILADFEFQVRVTQDCSILQACEAVVCINGVISGTGAITNVPFDNMELITGHEVEGGICETEPIPAPLCIDIDAALYVSQNCGAVPEVREFFYCNTDATIPITDVLGLFPSGSRFYDASGTTEYTISNPFPATEGTVFYQAVLPGTTPCIIQFKITVKTIDTVPLVTTPVTYCQGETAAALTATPSNAGSSNPYELYYYLTTALDETPKPSITPSTTTPGSVTYYVAEGESGSCISPNRVPITVTVNAKPTVVITNPSAVCSPVTVDLTAAAITSGSTEGLTFTYWTNGAATLEHTSPAATPAGLYYIKGTVPGTGCYDIKPVTVTVNPLPEIAVTSDPACSVDYLTYSLEVTVSAGTVTSTAGTVTNIEENRWSVTLIPFGTNITVTVTDVNTCAKTLNITAPDCHCPVIPAPVSGGNQAFCTGSPIPAITATVGDGETVDWYGAETGGTALATGVLSYTPTEAGTYYAEARNTTSGCKSSTRTPITVTENPLPVVVINNPAAVCAPSTVDLTLAAVTIGSTDGLAFTYWTDEDATIAYTTPAEATAGTYYIKGTIPATGCFDIEPVVVTVNPLPTIEISTPPFCSVDFSTYSLSVTVSAGTVTSTAGTVTNNGGNSWTISAVPSGTNITLTVTDGNSCENTLVVTSPDCNCPVIPAPGSGGNEFYCFGSPIPEISASVQPGETVDWYDAATSGNLLLSSSLTYTPTAAGTFYAEARNTTSGCKSSTRTAVTVTENPEIHPSATHTDILCNGGNSTLTVGATGGTPGYTYSINGTEYQSSPDFTVTAGTYTVYAKDANGCIDTDTEVVTEPDAPTVLSVTSDIKEEGISLVHTITLTNCSANAETFAFSISENTALTPEDYTDGTTLIFSDGVTYDAIAGTISVPAGVLDFTVTVPSVEDTNEEVSEFYDLSVGGKPATGTITDDDSIIVVSVTSDTKEEGLSLVHTVTLSGTSVTAETFAFSITDNSATAGLDYSTTYIFSDGVINNGDGTITIPAGVLSFTVSVASLVDGNVEIDETYTIQVGTATGTGTILDDDILANNDSGSANGFTGGTAIENILENDLANSGEATLAGVTLTPLTADDPEGNPTTLVVINPDGSVTVLPGTPSGTYILTYRICEISNPAICDDAVVTVLVTNPSIEAIDDSYGPILGITGGTVSNILDNDLLNGVLLDPNKVVITSTPTGPLTVNPDGTVDVAPGTAAGTYYIDYTICEKINPANCSTATVTVYVDPIALTCTIAETDKVTCLGGADGSATVTPADGWGSYTYLWNDPAAQTTAKASGLSAGNYSVTVTDSKGNTSTCQVTITVEPDTTPPTIICPANVSVPTTAGVCQMVINLTRPTATDNCSTEFTFIGVRSDGLALTDPYPIGTTFVTWTATDGSGNVSDECIQNVEVTDDQNLVILTCADDRTVSSSSCSVPVPDLTASIEVIDNCSAAGSLVITQVPEAGTIVGLGETIVTITVTDGAGNSVSCSATLTVTGRILANDDTGSVVNGLLGGTSFTNVLVNDEVNCEPADLSNVTIRFISSTNPKVTLDGTNVVVAPGVPTGTYFLVYEICDKLNPGRCDQATVTVPVVTPAPGNIIDAIDDFGGANGITGGVAVPDVLHNDKLNGVIVLPSQVITTFISTTNPKVTMNGREVVVAPGTPAGTYYVNYRICEVLNPSNCDQAVVTVVVTIPINSSIIDAVPDFGKSKCIAGGTAVPDVLWNDKLNGQPVLASQVITTFIGTSHPNVTLDGTSVVVAPNTPAGVYYLDYRICEKLNPTNCDQTTVTITVTCPVMELDITKAAIDTTYSTPGDLIHYTLNVINKGTENSYYNLVVTDPNAVITSGNPIAVLLPGQTASLTAVHTVTQADIDAGKVLNAAMLEGTDPDGDPVRDTSNTVTVYGVRRPQLTITKYVTETTFRKVGEKINYTFEIFNCGNVTARDIEVWDENATILEGGKISSLAPRHTVTATGEHIVTQADLDSGRIVNIAKVEGIDPAGKPVRDDSNEVILYANQAARMVVALFAVEPSFDAVGDTINYIIAVKNYRNTQMSDIVVSDSNAVITSGSPIFRLASGKTALVYAYHIVTQADLNAGKVVNTAYARGKDYYDEIDRATSNEVTVFASQSPVLLVTKKANENAFSAVGDVIHYTNEIRNTGNVRITGIVLTDPNSGTIGSNQVSVLNPGGSATIMTTHTVTQADLNLGRVEKTASVTALDGNIQPIRFTSNSVAVAGIQKAQLSALLTSVENTYSLEGDTIHYQVEVKNSGNVTLTNLKVTEDGSGETSGISAVALLPGQTTVVTLKHAVTQSDVAAGQVVKIASACAFNPAGERVISLTNELAIMADRAEKLVVSNLAQEKAYGKAGDVIHFYITVKNLGRVPISNIAVSVPGATITGESVISTLAGPGTTTILASRVITQKDLNTGSISNQAQVTGTYPDGSAYQETSNLVTLYAVREPGLSTTFAATENTYKSVGDQINYSIEVRNTGNLSLSNVVIATSGNLVLSGNDPVNLEPGETTRLSAVYTIGISDLDAGKVVKSIQAIGKDPENKPVQVSSNEIAVTGLQTPELTTVATALESSYKTVGEVIHYSVVVTNSGNVSIISTAVTDPNAVVVDARPNVILLPGESFTVAATHIVTQQDINAGSITTVAKAEGFDLNGNTITKLGNKVTVAGIQFTELTLANSPSASIYKKVGDVISYSIQIRNLGNISIFNMKVTDPNAVINSSATVPVLEPGEAYTVSATHTVTQEDLDAGKVINIAKAAGADLNGNPVEKTGSKVTILAMQRPDMITTTGVSTAKFKNEGDIVEFTVVVSNTGNITMNNVRASDANADLVFTRSIASLAPGETDSIKAQYRVTVDDINAGKIVNAGIAEAHDVNDRLYVYQGNEVTVRMAIDNYNLTNFPNPFTYETTIVFDLPEKGKVHMRVYDMTGREVGEIDQTEFNEGRNFVHWRTTDIPKGLYILKMLCNGEQAVRRIIIGD